MKTRFATTLAALLVPVVLTACWGDGDSSTAAPTTTTLSGSVVKGPVNGATITVKNAATGAVLGTTTTGAGGSYSLEIDFQGDVIVEASGGSYTDEATGSNTNLSQPLRVVLAANGGTVTGVVTPLTTMAYSLAQGSGSSVTSSAFNTQASQLATQFQLGSANLATTVPVVTGTVNDYGKALVGVSKYLQLNSKTLSDLLGSAMTSTQWTTFATQYNAAYKAAYPDSNVTFSFTGNGVVIDGSGGGGGSGTCGINVQGTVTANGFTVPLNLNYCVQGMAGGSCDSGNTALSQAVSGQQGMQGAANLSYTYSASCAAGAFTITLQ